MTIAQLLEDIGLIKVTDSGKVEWDNNSLQNIMQIDVTQLLLERGIMQVADITTMQAVSGQETNAIAIDQTGLFLFRDTGIPNFTTIFPATGGGVWVKQTGTVGGVVWGAITGTLSNQTDLQTSLNTKVPTSRVINGHALTTDITITKEDVGLGHVEDTALSTWAGTTNLVILGVVTTGAWQGVPVDIPFGGTNADNRNSAINNLLPDQNLNSGKFLATNGIDVFWATPTGLLTIYNGDGTISVTRVVTADTGSGVSGEFRINGVAGGDLQWLGIKDAGTGSLSGVLVRPLMDPNDGTSSPLVTMSSTDTVSGITYQSNVYLDRYNVALQQVIGTRFRQLNVSKYLNEAVYDDSDGYGIGYTSNYNVALASSNSIVPKSYVDSKVKGALATFSGNGATTVFNIPHGLSSTPTSAVITANTLDAHSSGGRVSSITSSNIVVTCYVAPVSGTNNVKWYWQATT